jgi:hypothetical protein
LFHAIAIGMLGWTLMSEPAPATARPRAARCLVVPLALAASTCASTPTPAPVPPTPDSPVGVAVALPPPKPVVVGAAYRERYPVKTALDKIVTNRGTGHEELYGTRNVRAVLNGVYYRGGANNAFHRKSKRNNSNPLPDDGLANLCQEGFGTALYMYPTRYETAPPSETCQTYEGDPHQLDYGQVSVLRGRRDDIRRILATVHEHIRKPELGPVYVHCWNGWHASGYAAAATLRQFCGFTAEQAVRYWDLNTDGVNNGRRYEKVRELIRKFTPFPELTITSDERAALCPDPETFAFRPDV